MAYETEPKPVQSHKGAELQKKDYAKVRSGGHTTRSTIPEGLHPQAPRNKGYTKPRPK